MASKFNRGIVSHCRNAFLMAVVVVQAGSAQSLVRDVDNKDLNGWQRTVFMTSMDNRFFNSAEFSENIGTVPQGKRLVVDHVTGRYAFNGGDIGFCNFGVRTGTSSNGNFYLPYLQTANTVWPSTTAVQVFNQPMRFFADSGQVRLTCVHTVAPGKAMFVWLTVVGHLVDATPENDPFK